MWEPPHPHPTRPPVPLSSAQRGETVKLESRGWAREVTFGTSFWRFFKGSFGQILPQSLQIVSSGASGRLVIPSPRRQQGETRRQKLQVFKTTGPTACSEPPPKRPQEPRRQARTYPSSETQAAQPRAGCKTDAPRRQAGWSSGLPGAQRVSWRKQLQVLGGGDPAGPPDPPGKRRATVNILMGGGQSSVHLCSASGSVGHGSEQPAARLVDWGPSELPISCTRRSPRAFRAPAPKGTNPKHGSSGRKGGTFLSASCQLKKCQSKQVPESRLARASGPGRRAETAARPGQARP